MATEINVTTDNICTSAWNTLERERGRSVYERKRGQRIKSHKHVMLRSCICSIRVARRPRKYTHFDQRDRRNSKCATERVPFSLQTNKASCVVHGRHAVLITDALRSTKHTIFASGLRSEASWKGVRLLGQCCRAKTMRLKHALVRKPCTHPLP